MFIFKSCFPDSIIPLDIQGISKQSRYFQLIFCLFYIINRTYTTRMAGDRILWRRSGRGIWSSVDRERLMMMIMIMMTMMMIKRTVLPTKPYGIAGYSAPSYLSYSLQLVRFGYTFIAAIYYVRWLCWMDDRDRGDVRYCLGICKPRPWIGLLFDLERNWKFWSIR